MLYRGMDRAALDAAYDNGAAVAPVRRERYFADRAKEVGGDPARVFVVGNSAGGHLTAMATTFRSSRSWRAPTAACSPRSRRCRGLSLHGCTSQSRIAGFSSRG